MIVVRTGKKKKEKRILVPEFFQLVLPVNNCFQQIKFQKWMLTESAAPPQKKYIYINHPSRRYHMDHQSPIVSEQ